MPEHESLGVVARERRMPRIDRIGESDRNRRRPSGNVPRRQQAALVSRYGRTSRGAGIAVRPRARREQREQQN